MRVQFLLVLLLALSTSRLVFVVENFRHGARNTFYKYYNGWEQEADHGELLSSGMRQEYNLGRQLRKEYIEELGFLKPTYDHNEFYVRSTDVNRTLMSAHSHLMGLYPEGPSIPVGLEEKYLIPPFEGAQNYIKGESALPNFFQPMSLHTVPSAFDDLLDGNCGAAEKAANAEDIKEVEGLTEEILARTRDLRATICRKFKQQDSFCDQFKNIYALRDIYLSNIQLNKQNPNLTEEELYTFNTLSAYYFSLSFGGYRQTQLINTPYYRNLIQQFQQKIDNPQSTLKWIAYSSHDTNAIQFTISLNLTSPQCIFQAFVNNGNHEGVQCITIQPPFVTSSIFELHQTEETNDYYVRFRYNGVYQPLCGSTDTYCSFSEFSQRLQNYIYSENDYNKLCHASTSNEIQLSQIMAVEQQSQTLFYVMMLQSVVILGLMVYIKLKPNKNVNEYTNSIDQVMIQ